MKRRRRWMAAVGVVGVVAGSVVAGPEVTHAPVLTATRGVPVVLGAQIVAPDGGAITQAVARVRLTEAGKPLVYAMTAAGGGAAYQATVPVTVFDGVKMFWYSLDARDDAGEVGGTRWFRVVVADPLDPRAAEGAAAAAGAAATQGSGGGGGGSLGWVAGGALLAGGAVAVIAADDDDDNGGGSSAGSGGAVVPPPPKKQTTADGGGSGGGDRDLSGLTNVLCRITGNEQVSYANLSMCESFDDILILICNTCVNTSIRAVGSWGVSDARTGYTNLGCNGDAPRLALLKPDGFPTPLSETITVYVNDVVVDTIAWPPQVDFDCF